MPNTSHKPIFCPLFLAAAILSPAAGAFAQCGAIQLTTPPNYVSNNGGGVGGMVYFTLDVSTPSGISVCSIFVNTSVAVSAPITCEVYLHRSITDWNLLTSVNNAATDWCKIGDMSGMSNGVDAASPMTISNLTNSIELLPGQYLLAIGNGDFGHRYTNGTGANQSASDANITFTAGQAANTIYATGLFNPRVVNATFDYNVGATPPAPTLVINEFAYDDNGAPNDIHEFVELYNNGAAPVSLAGWLLRVERATGGTLNYFLPPATIPPCGYYVIGAAGVANVNHVISSPAFYDTTAGMNLIAPIGPGLVVDSVVYEGYAGTVAGFGEGQSIFPEFLSVVGNQTSWSRMLDGLDTDNNGVDFELSPATPGAANGAAPTTLPYKEMANTTPIGTTVSGWTSTNGSVPVLPVVAAPPASGTGGNVIEFPVAVGANTGTSYSVPTDPEDGSFFLADVYFDVTQPPAPNGTRRAWSIGVRGHTGPYYGLPNPLWSSNFTDQNGDTGVAWTFVVTRVSSSVTKATLYLIDKGDGGSDHVLLHIEDITASGWRSLGLHVAGCRCVATFDGNCTHDSVHYTTGDHYVGLGASTSAAQLPLYIDNHCLEAVGDQANPLGLGCQGNCEQTNFDADTLDTAPTRDHGPGRYAIEMTTSSVPFGPTHFCLLSGSRTDQPTLSTVTVRGGHSVAGPNSSVFAGPIPLKFHPCPSGSLATFNELGPGWWAADLGGFTFAANTTYFLEFDIDANLYLPIASKEGGDQPYSPDSSQIWAFNGSWSEPTAAMQNWAWAFICPSDTGDAQAESCSELTPGTTMVLMLRGGAANNASFGFLALGPPILPGLDLTGFGAPGCLLYTPLGGGATLFVPTNARGEAEWLIPIPPGPGLIGLVLTSQWAAADPGLNALGWVSTNALRLEIQ